MNNLFRTRALEAARLRQLGEPISLVAPSSAILIGAVVAVVLILCAFVLIAPLNRTVTAPGVFKPSLGLVQLRALSANSVVLELKKSRGDHVEAGDTIAVLSTERWTNPDRALHSGIAKDLARSKRSFEAERVALAQKRTDTIAAYRSRSQEIETSVARLDAEVSKQSAHAAELRTTLEHVLKNTKGYVTKLDQLSYRDRLLSAEGRVVAFQIDVDKQKEALQGLRLGLKSDLAELDIRLAGVESSLANLDVRETTNEADRLQLVVAPITGSVADVLVDEGQQIHGQALVATIVGRNDELSAEVLVPATRAGFVRVGLPVIMKVHAFPYTRFGTVAGTVEHLSTITYQADNLSAPAAGQPVFKAKVLLASEGASHSLPLGLLRNGMTFDGEIVLGRERGYQWLLEKLTGVLQ